MKNIRLGLAIIATTLAACNSNTETKKIGVEKDSTTKMLAQKEAPKTAGTFPTKEIITSYLQLKDALTKDNSKEAATAGNTMVVTLASVDINALSTEQMKPYTIIADDLKENAEHIGANAGKLDHQREHFEILSKDMADIITIFGNGGQILYKDFCPMFNNGKGAIWISESKDIKNPYLGKAMPTCGTIKAEMK